MTEEEKECNCKPLYRTYRVTKMIIILPPLATCAAFTVGLHNIGTLISLPVEYIINGNIYYTIRNFNERTEYIQRTFYDISVCLIS